MIAVIAILALLGALAGLARASSERLMGRLSFAKFALLAWTPLLLLAALDFMRLKGVLDVSLKNASTCQRQSNFDPLGGKVKLTHPRRFIRYCAGLELGLCQRLSYLSVDSCSQRSVQYVHGVAADRARPLLTFGHQRRRLTTGRTASCSSR